MVGDMGLSMEGKKTNHFSGLGERLRSVTIS